MLRAGRAERIVVVATEAKLAALGGAPLRVDTGDPALDAASPATRASSPATAASIVYPVAS